MIKSSIRLFGIVMIAWWVCPPAGAKVIRVPEDYTRIQAAIDASSKNDVIKVAPGTYYENLHLKGDRSLIGAGGESTILVDDGKGAPDPVVEITGQALLQGFTITRSRGAGVGHAIMVLRGSPIIIDNIIRDNAYTGLGIHSQVSFTAPIVAGNKIFGNGGAGIATLGKFARPVILRNKIFNNTNVGIACTDSANPWILDNNIHDNGAGVALKDGSNGKVIKNQVIGNKLVGLNVSKDSSVTIINNNFMSNGSTGINVDQSPSTIIVRNTIVDNGAEGVFVKGKSKVLIDRNIISGNLPTLVQSNNSTVTFTNNQVYAQEVGGGFGIMNIAVIARNNSKFYHSRNEVIGGIDADTTSKEVRLDRKKKGSVNQRKIEVQRVIDRKSKTREALPVNTKSCLLFFWKKEK